MIAQAMIAVVQIILCLLGDGSIQKIILLGAQVAAERSVRSGWGGVF
jgi:hypothetical protein